MKHHLEKIHALPEDTRKVLAGLTIVIVGLGFVSAWTSFMSSRLVTLGTPAEQQRAGQAPGVPVARRLSPAEIAEAKRQSPPSPVAGIAGSVSDAGKLIAPTQGMAAGLQGFFASVGRGMAVVAEDIYMKAAPWVPPY